MKRLAAHGIEVDGVALPDYLTDLEAQIANLQTRVAALEAGGGGGGPASGYATEVLADSPVLYLRLDEAAGTTSIADASSSGFNGVHQAGVVAGEPSLLGSGVGKAARYTAAADSYTRIPYGAGMNQNAFTVEARIRLDPAALTGVRVIAGRYGSSGTTARAWQFAVSSGKLRATIRPASGSTETGVTGATTLTANQNYTVTFTHDGTTLRLYLNGFQDASIGVGTVNAPTSDLTLATLDSALGTTANYLPGVIDEFSLTPSVLTPSRILDRHNAAVAA